MKKKIFAELVESIREAGKVHRGEAAPSRPFVFTSDNFLDLAGSVTVPPEKKGAHWAAIKATAWRLRSKART